MQAATDADFGFYDVGSAVGVLRPGPIRTGDLYTAESWENTVRTVAIRGADVTGEFAADLAARNLTLDPERTYRVANIEFIANEILDEVIGPGEIVAEHGYLREMSISYVRSSGVV